MSKIGIDFAGAVRAWFGRAGGLDERQRAVAMPPVVDCNDIFAAEATAQLNQKRRDIETSLVDAATAQRFMDRVSAQWQALGEADPYWSNDTQDHYRIGNLTDATINRFYEEGLGVGETLAAFESRCGVDIGHGTCLELGCGVGKLTFSLGRRFARVIGVDVSRSALAVCDRQMKRLGLDNVTTMSLATPSDLVTCGAIDVFVSLSVLQHNPPPIQRQLLEQAFTALRGGGFALFQVPDYREGYSFSTAAFLTAEEAVFDIHCLPKTEVLAILEACGMKLLDFAPDGTIGALGSYTFFARKL